MHFKVLSDSDAASLSSMLKSGNWMILYYADWCGHCKTMKPEWEKATSKLTKSKHINIAEIESSHISKLTPSPIVEGFPTLKMYVKGKEVAQFDDERVADKMTKFALSNSSKHVKSASHGKSHKTISKHIRSPTRKSHHVAHKSHHVAHKSHKTRSVVKLSNANRVSRSQKTIKSVFDKLIKSFGKIGNEADKDKAILKSAQPML